MRRLSDLPIKQKLTLISLLTTLVALVLACTGFVAYELVTFRKDLVADVSSVAEIVGYNSASALSFNDASSAEQTLRALSAKPHIVAACIYDREGRVFATYPPGHGAADFAPPPAGAAERFGPGYLDLFRPIAVAGETAGTIYLRTDLGIMRERLQRYALILGLVMIVSIFVAYLIASRLQRVISAPIANLVTVTNRVAVDKDYTIRAVKRGDDELGRLIDGFNEMLVQIQARDAALRSARDKLEERVAERTHDLQQENAERKRAEEALRTSQQITEGIINAIPVRVFWKDKNLVYLGCNTVFARDAGYADPKDIIGKDDYQMGWRNQAEAYRQDDRQVIENGNSRLNIEESQATPAGNTITIITNKIPLLDANGKISGVLGTYVDFTERKRAEEALRESEERFSGAFEHAPIGVALVSPDGRWLKVNRALCDLVGYSEAELLTRTFQDITCPADLADDLEQVRRLLAGEIRSYQQEKRYVHARGHLVTVLLNASLVRDGQGQPRYFISQIQDITKRKLAEAALEKANQELVDVSRQAGMAEVATSVLHNVGNVLNSVNVSATLVADHVRHTKAVNIAKLATLFDQHKADLVEFLTKDSRGQTIPAYLGSLAESLVAEQNALLTEIAHLRKNVEHIKDIVAMQQSYAQTSGFIETISLPDLIEDALRINAGSLARHDVDTLRDYQTRPVVTTDKHKVMQILINLVRNAKYACDESGRTDKQIIVRLTSDSQGVKIAIIDNGVGIPTENLTRIFNHGFTTRKHGHGFGLHSGALAAKELGGSLSVQSDGPGHGATFILGLPYKPDTTAHENPVR